MSLRAISLSELYYVGISGTSYIICKAANDLKLSNYTSAEFQGRNCKRQRKFNAFSLFYIYICMEISCLFFHSHERGLQAHTNNMLAESDPTSARRSQPIPSPFLIHPHCIGTSIKSCPIKLKTKCKEKMKMILQVDENLARI